MKTKLLGTALALGLAAAPFAATAGGVSGGNANSDWTIYGWQNWSWENRSIDTTSIEPGDPTRERNLSQINGNATNIGFAASIDTGLSMGGAPIKANFRCEQFTFHNRFNGSGFGGLNDLCNRNSKISLSGAFGEFMMGQWLLPHNEMVAQWVDPFYDAGADSHSSIMGSVGYGTLFFNGGFGFTGAGDQGFNRRQNEIFQYWSPNLNGFTFRVATTNASTAGQDETEVVSSLGTVEELDPRIWSMGVAYENTLANGDNIWLAATYETHDEWAATSFACDDSDDDSYRIAGRYIKQWGNGMSTQISAMWETLEYDWSSCAGGTLLSGAGGTLGASATELDLERDAWMVSGKQTFGNGFDFRFSYMDGDEFDCNTCADDSDTEGEAFNLGVYYTMPAGTELRVTYSEVDNEDNASYDFGINTSGVRQGGQVDMWALGIVQWF